MHSFFLCGLDLVFQQKMAIFDHNPLVHSFFLASKLQKFVSYISIDSFDCLTKKCGSDENIENKDKVRK